MHQGQSMHLKMCSQIRDQPLEHTLQSPTVKSKPRQLHHMHLLQVIVVQYPDDKLECYHFRGVEQQRRRNIIHTLRVASR